MVCVVLVLVLITSGCSLLPREEQALQPPLVEPVKDNTETYKVQVGTITKEVKGTGVFETSKIFSHRFTGPGGRVEEVFVKPGDTVQKGDLLIQLDIEDLDLHMMQQELDLERAKHNLAQARKSEELHSIKLSQLEFEIAQLKYEKTKKRLASKQLIAKMDGTVVFLEDLKPLDRVDHDRALVYIGDTSHLQFFYEASSANELLSVQVGMEVEVTHGGNTYIGNVTQTPYSSPSSEDSRLMERYNKTIYINFDEMPENVSFGDQAQFVVVTEKEENTMIIPRRGLRSYLDRDYVYILDGESRQEVDVEVGIKGSTQVEIISGIEEGQLVILQ